MAPSSPPIMQIKRLAVPAYLVAFLLVFFPLLDTLLSVWPVRAGDIAWRFGAAGLFSRALMTPLLGLLLAMSIALLLEHRRAVRALAILSAAAALAITVGIPLFMLDALQMRSQVRPEAKTAFDLASTVALGKYFFVMLALGGLTLSGWRASKRKGVGKVAKAWLTSALTGVGGPAQR